MSQACPECGAALPPGGACRDLFHALLVKEAEIPDAPGTVLHFYLVATYALQHPEGMNYTLPALTGLRDLLADLLDGRADLEAARRRSRQGAKEAGRVSRRPEDVPFTWPHAPWTLTAADLLAADLADYPERLLAWARAVRDALVTPEPTAPGGRGK